MNHIDQEAELYALGMFDDDERARIDEHLATCAPCTVLVGEAEAAVAALGLLGQNVVMHGALGNDGALLATMVDSHFDHAQFQAPGGGEIPAKVVYERHGKWYEILADGTPAWHVVFVRPDGTRDAATAEFARRGAASAVYLAPSTPVRTIELEDATGHVIGIVNPALK